MQPVLILLVLITVWQRVSYLTQDLLGRTTLVHVFVYAALQQWIEREGFMCNRIHCTENGGQDSQ